MQRAWAGLLLWEFFQVTVEENQDDGEKQPRRAGLLLSRPSRSAIIPEGGPQLPAQSMGGGV